MTIGIQAFDRLIKLLMMRIDRLESQIVSGKRTVQPITTTVIKGKEYFDVYALREIFRVTAHTIYRWRDEGTLPLVKIGGKYYIEVAVLHEVMAKGMKTEPTR